MNIVIVNSVSLNGGDAAILVSLLDAIRREWGNEVNVTILDSHARAAQRLFPELAFRQGFQPARSATRGLFAGKRKWFERRVSLRVRYARLLAAAALIREGLNTGARAACSDEEFDTLARFRDADLVISTGGTYLVPNYHLEGRLFELSLAHVFGVPLLLYTQSIGALAGTPSADAVRYCLERAAKILLRDERSLANLRALGLDCRNVTLCPDSVFSFVRKASRDRGAEELWVRDPGVDAAGAPASASRTRGLDVVISVRDWAHFENGSARDAMARYRDAVAESVTWLVRERGARVRFLSTCQGSREYDYDDSAIADAVFAAIAEPYRSRVTVDRAKYTPMQLLEELGRADLVVATRMHMAIFGLCAGATVLPIAYEFKTEELFRGLGVPHWVESIDHVTAPSLIQRLELVLREAPEQRARLDAKLLDMKRDATAALRGVPALLAARSRRFEQNVNWMWTRVSPEEGVE